MAPAVQSGRSLRCQDLPHRFTAELVVGSG